MNVIIQRDRDASNKVVFGKMILPMQGAPDIYTVEILNCIPAGTYELIGHQGSKKDVWELKDVPGHTAILIHVGNYACEVTLPDGSCHESDSLGCILVGFGIDENALMIKKSGAAVEYLRNLWGVKDQGQPMNITVEVRD